MLTQIAIDDIDKQLKEGKPPEDIAASMGLKYHQLRAALLNSGKKWVVDPPKRRLVDCAPAPIGEQAPEMAAV